MKCYICDGVSFKNRPGSVRDAPKLGILQCGDCGLVCLDSFAHISKEHYENSGMHGDNLPSIISWL